MRIHRYDTNGRIIKHASLLYMWKYLKLIYSKFWVVTKPVMKCWCVKESIFSLLSMLHFYPSSLTTAFALRFLNMFCKWIDFFLWRELVRNRDFFLFVIMKTCYLYSNSLSLSFSLFLSLSFSFSLSSSYHFESIIIFENSSITIIYTYTSCFWSVSLRFKYHQHSTSFVSISLACLQRSDHMHTLL